MVRSLCRISAAALLTCALALTGAPRAYQSGPAPMEHAWSFEVLQHYTGTVSECHPSLMLTGFGVTASGTTAAGWYEGNCGLPNSAADAGLVAAVRSAGAPWTFIRQNDTLCGYQNCHAIHGRPALTLNEDGHPFYVFSAPGPNDTYHVYVQDMVSGLPAARRMPVAATQSSQSHLNISATVAAGQFLPTFAWAAITGFGGPLMLGLPDGQVTLGGPAVWSLDSFDRHVVAYANPAAGLGVYYSPGEAGVLRPVLPTTYNDGVSIAVGPDGRIHIAASGGPTGSGTQDGRLVYLWSDDAGVTWARTDLDLTTTRSPSIALDRSGVPAIVYARNQELRFARLSGATWKNTLLADLPLGDSGIPAHLAFDPTDRPQVLFYNRSTRDIMLATAALEPAAPKLTVSRVGTGAGTVASLPDGINCGSDCTEVYDTGRSVLLTAAPDGASAFAGWAGACTGVGACLLRMDEAKNVAASFVRLADQPAIEVAVPGSGGCTLKDAIHAANADAAVGLCPAGHGADVIHVPAGTYTLTTVDNTTFGLLTGLPIVTSNITLIGDGADATVIERGTGAPEFRLLRVWHVGAQLTLRGLTVRGGHGSESGGGGVYANGPLIVRDVLFTENEGGTHGGGAIRFSGWPLTISNSRFVNNRSSGFQGGALYGNGDASAPLNITNSTFEGNQAIRGGAIAYSGAGIAGTAGLVAGTSFTSNTARHAGGAMEINGVTLARVTVTGNRVTAPGDGGGGLFVDGVTILDSSIANNTVSGAAGGGGILSGASSQARPVTISRTTIAGNTAQFGGGAALGGLSTLANVTLSGNRSTGNGGALSLGGGQTDLNNVTITDNQSTLARAGGIASESFAVVRLRNSILSGNRDALGSPDCYSTGHALQSVGANLLGIIGDCNYAPGAGDLVGTSSLPIDARLGQLGDNGGGTWTHEPASSSPAVDAGGSDRPGDPGACEATDQRGVVRPQRAGCDIGAVERSNHAPTVTPTGFTTPEDTPIEIVLAAADEDGDAVTLEVSQSPAHGGLSGAFPTYVYSPLLNFNGADSFTVVARDSLGAARSVVVQITVTPVNDPPAAVDDGVSVLVNAGISAVPVLANDSTPDAGETLSVTAVTAPAHGTVAIGAGGTHVNYTPAQDYTGLDSFTYTVGDGNGSTASALVTVNVLPRVADLAIDVTDEPDPLALGGSLVYRVRVRNQGTVAAGNAVITATLPTGGGGTETSAHALGPIAAGSEATTLIVRLPQASGVYNAQFSVTSGEPDPDLLNNVDTEQTIVGAAVVVVNSTGHSVDLNTADGVCDTGGGSAVPECTLRAAIETANTTPGTIIAFRIPAGERGFANGVFTIQPGNNLPAITADGTVVEATTQTAFTGDTNPLGPEIVLRGASNRDDSPTGLHIQAPNVVIRGLVVNGFSTGVACTFVSCGRGIYIQSEERYLTGVRIEGSYIGVDPAAVAAAPNGRGIEVGLGTVDAVVGGIGGGRGNVISGNTETGIFLDTVSERTTIQGNFVGTNRTGTAAVPNGGGGGVFIFGASATVIGGAATGAGNVISGNSGFGIVAISHLRQAGPMPIHSSIQGNLIGTDATGTTAVGNQGGVFLSGDGHWLAGTAPGIRNVISGNRTSGVVITGEGRSLVLGNYIGTDITGLLPLANGSGAAADAGIRVVSGTSTIGGYGFGDANTIAFNDGDGVLIEQPSPTSPTMASIRGNSIHGNARLGIDAGGNGVSAATVPVITAAGNVGATTIVTGTVGALPNQTVGVELFGNTTCDPTGYGEGATPLHVLSATADASGQARFRAVFAGSLDAAASVTAVATDSLGQSSEFSACRMLGTGLSDLGVELTPSRDPAWSGFDLTWQVKVTNTGAANSDIRVATTFPAGLTYSPLPAACTISGDVVTCTAPTLVSGASVSFDIIVQPATAGPMTVAASVAGYQPDPNTLNDGQSVTLPVVAVVVIEVVEQIAVIDQPVVTPSVMLTVSEQIGVVDSTVVTPAVMLTIAEQVGVTDTPGLEVFNTPVGPNVMVRPVDAVTGTTPISVAFSSVVQTGTTTVTSSAVGAPIPAGFRTGTPAVYYDVSTTAGVTGPIQVCINYAGVSFAPTNLPRLFHFEGAAWVDRTTSTDAATTTVCGTVTSLSPFALFTPDTISPTVEGRMTGNGEITDAARHEHRFHFKIAERSIGNERGQLTYSVKTPKAGAQKAQNDDFESTSIGPMAFWDDLSFRAGNGRQPTSDSATFAGTGRWNGKAGYTFEARAADEGEPGRGRDTFAITIRNNQGAVVATVDGVLSQGNIQSKRLPGR